MSTPSEHVIDPAGGRPANASLILLHGLGADGHDLAPLVPAFVLPDSVALRTVLPHAPRLPVTINGGMQMPAWYDILEMNLGRRVDETQLRASAKRVHELIDAEIARGIDSRRIILAGFSQGGAVAYEAALTYPKPLGGLLALSTYFATADSIVPGDANRDLPIEVHHGTFDPVVPEALGREGAERAEAMGHPLTYRSYPMQHAICPQQIARIGTWLGERLGEDADTAGKA
ncbi:alpha/beta fold hydrolase [Halomonas sp. YLGW01]|uniref:alpha/beta hydrolase n=1 Tax=Halomonas sp. YLGW01 TaxID=2773308 RepID=UPI00177CC079|nr:alpha/beta fold hydrolase [Halomonas sp. YLGW01]